jgi:hypothetical protein
MSEAGPRYLPARRRSGEYLPIFTTTTPRPDQVPVPPQIISASSGQGLRTSFHLVDQGTRSWSLGPRSSERPYETGSRGAAACTKASKVLGGYGQLFSALLFITADGEV